MMNEKNYFQPGVCGKPWNIQATGTVELRMAWGLESSLKAFGAIFDDCTEPRINFNPLLGSGWFSGWCSCHIDPFQTSTTRQVLYSYKL